MQHMHAEDRIYAGTPVEAGERTLVPVIMRTSLRCCSGVSVTYAPVAIYVLEDGEGHLHYL